MTLFTALVPECVAVGLTLSDKAEALRKISELAKTCPALANVSQADILHGLEQREELGSTGFGHEIAIPHCRLPGVSDFVVGILTIPDGVDFAALDGEKVRFIAFIIGPEDQSKTHIHLLSGISQALANPDVVDEMVAAISTESLREQFLRHVRDEIEPIGEDGRCLFHVFVQDESLFEDILQVFGGIESSSAVVLSAENTGVYLSHSPLFADIWRDNPSRFCQVIVATVSKSISNETIRRIERSTGSLAKRSDVMVVVQDVFYYAGSIDQ
jgi:PTS system nitrogen regulatory IIA component